MTLVGLDQRASRARPVEGPRGDYPMPLSLAGADSELPLTLNLAAAHVEVGASGEKLRRRLPYLACHSFLAYLGEKKHWTGGKHCLDAFQAAEQVWKQLAPAMKERRGLVLSIPDYLSRW